jgi:hypothetical protein
MNHFKYLAKERASELDPDALLKAIPRDHPSSWCNGRLSSRKAISPTTWVLSAMAMLRQSALPMMPDRVSCAAMKPWGLKGMQVLCCVLVLLFESP